MKKTNRMTVLFLKAMLVITMLYLFSIPAQSQCNTTAWQARVRNSNAGGFPPPCVGNWLNAAQFVNATGALQILPGAANLGCATGYNYYPEFEMNGNFCITNNFSYELRLRNAVHGGDPNTYTAYDVVVKLRSANNTRESGVILMHGGSGTYSWAWPSTRLFDGPAGAPNQNVGGGDACLHPNLDNWTTVTLKFQNSKLYCLIGGTLCDSVTYTNPICTISSLSVLFKAAGELDWVRILDANNNEMWREDFYNTATPGCFTPFPACTITNMAPTFTAPTCADNKLYLFANPNQQLSGYSWTGPNGFTSTLQNPFISNPTSAANGTYTVTGRLNNCDSAISRNVVVSFTVPGITSNIPDVSICNGDSVQLTASGGGTYSWTPNTNISSTTIANPIVWPNTTTNYIVTITNGSCSKIDTVIVTVNNCTKCNDSCYWNILGNGHITPANFLGTTNSADLRIRTNNRERMIITAAGNVGINLNATQLPNARFHINNNGTTNTRLENLPVSKQPANLYVDGQGFVYSGRRSIFGRETDDADKDIETRILSLEKHIDNVSINTSVLSSRSQSDLTIINDMQSLVTTLSDQVTDLQSQIDAINQRLDNCGCWAYKAPPKGGDKEKTANKPSVEKAVIVSVNPNPFAKTTMVHYSIPPKTQQAELRLMNIAGVVIKTYTINNKQPDGSIAISEPFVSKGSYLVVLIADGKIADSKIIVTTGN